MKRAVLFLTLMFAAGCPAQSSLDPQAEPSPSDAVMGSWILTDPRSGCQHAIMFRYDGVYEDAMVCPDGDRKATIGIYVVADDTVYAEPDEGCGIEWHATFVRSGDNLTLNGITFRRFHDDSIYLPFTCGVTAATVTADRF